MDFSSSARRSMATGGDGRGGSVKAGDPVPGNRLPRQPWAAGDARSRSAICLGAPRRSPRSPSRPHGPLGCRSFPPAPPLTDPLRPGKQQSRAHRSTGRTGICNPLLAQPRDQKLFRHLHSAERNPLPDSNSSFLFWDLNEELPLAAKARAVPFGQAPALLVLGSVAPSKASRDPAC